MTDTSFEWRGFQVRVKVSSGTKHVYLYTKANKEKSPAFFDAKVSSDVLELKPVMTIASIETRDSQKISEFQELAAATLIIKDHIEHGRFERWIEQCELDKLIQNDEISI
jgi:uncharacterized pyridoxal phosphate-containing UPF0001 family protein